MNAISPIFPTQAVFRFQSRTCSTSASSYPDPNVPQWWAYSATPTQSPGVMQGVKEFNSACSALFYAGSSSSNPFNQSDLQAFANQFTLDYFNWIQTQFDLVYVGICNLAQSGLYDSIEFDYNRSCTTRVYTYPDDDPQVRELAHQEPNVDSMCADTNSPTLVSSREPCLEMFGPGVISGGVTTLDKYTVCLEDGKLVRTFDGQVTLPCGCGEGCCGFPCSPCTIPYKDLAISWTNPLNGNGSDVLAYNGQGWGTGCSGGGDNQLIFKFFCTNGQIELRAYYFTSGICPTGQNNYCSNLKSAGFQLVLKSSTCFPFSILFDLTLITCPEIAGSGYTSFTVYDPSPPPKEPSGCCVTICALNCLTQMYVPGVTITIADPTTGNQIATGVTASNGCVQLDIVKAGTYNIASSGGPIGYVPITNSNISLTCCQRYVLQGGSVSVNVNYCSVPVGVMPPTVSGIPIQVLNGMTVVAGGMTDINGNFAAELAQGGNVYTITATYNGQIASTSCTLYCQNQVNVQTYFTIGTPMIDGCFANFQTPAGVEGAEVTIVGLGPAQTTDENGRCPIGWIFPAGPLYLCPNPPIYTITVSCPPRFADSTSTVGDGNAYYLPCINVYLQPADEYVCYTGAYCIDCNLPIKKTLNFTDTCLGTSGVATWNPNAWGVGIGDWVGTTTASFPSYSIDGCECLASTSTLIYYLIGPPSPIGPPEPPCGELTASQYLKTCPDAPGGNIGCLGPGDLITASVTTGVLSSCPEGFMFVGNDNIVWPGTDCSGGIFPIIWTEA